MEYKNAHEYAVEKWRERFANNLLQLRRLVFEEEQPSVQIWTWTRGARVVHAFQSRFIFFGWTKSRRYRNYYLYLNTFIWNLFLLFFLTYVVLIIIFIKKKHLMIVFLYLLLLFLYFKLFNCLNCYFYRKKLNKKYFNLNKNNFKVSFLYVTLLAWIALNKVIVSRFIKKYKL